MKRASIFIAAVLLIATQASANELIGKVVSVTDGDTIKVLESMDGSNVTHKIRLQHIDAPEKSQAFGNQAKKALSGYVFDKEVNVFWSEKDRYGRIIGVVVFPKDSMHPSGTMHWNANVSMIADGFAWHYKQYSSNRVYSAIEKEAREAKRGLWADPNPTAPWNYRQQKRLKSKSKSSTAQKSTNTTSSVVQDSTNTSSTVTNEAAETYWLNTKSNSRHNKDCKWFKKTKQGRICKPDEGKPCGQCGG